MPPPSPDAGTPPYESLPLDQLPPSVPRPPDYNAEDPQGSAGAYKKWFQQELMARPEGRRFIIEFVAGRWEAPQSDAYGMSVRGTFRGRQLLVRANANGSNQAFEFVGGTQRTLPLPHPEYALNRALQSQIKHLRDQMGGPSSPETVPSGWQTGGTPPNQFSRTTINGVTYYVMHTAPHGPYTGPASGATISLSNLPAGTPQATLNILQARIKQVAPSSAPSSTVPPTAPTGAETVGALTWTTRQVGSETVSVTTVGGYDYYIFHSGQPGPFRIAAGATTGSLQNVSMATLPDNLRKGLEARLKTVNPSAAPSAAPVTPSAPESSPALTGNPREDAVNAIAALRFSEFPGVTFAPIQRSTVEHHLNTTNVQNARAEVYRRSVTDAANNMREALRRRGGSANGQMTFDGVRFRFTGGGEELVANSRLVLKKNNAAGYPEWYTIDGGTTNVRWSPSSPRVPGSLAATHDVYEVQMGDGQYQMQLFRQGDGSIAQRQYGTLSGNTLQMSHAMFYSGNRGSLRSARPDVIRVVGRSATVNIPSANGSASLQSYAINRGTHYVPESGAPTGRYQPEQGPPSSPSARLTASVPAAEVPRIDAYLNRLASLGSAEAITAAITANFDFAYRGQAQGLVTGQLRDYSIQHAVRTVWLGTGNCQDFANLIKEVCRRAGVNSIVCKCHDEHTAAYTIKRAGSGYILCKMHVLGYEEIPPGNGRSTPFSSPQQALQLGVWEPSRSRYPTPLHYELAQIDAYIARNGANAEVSAYRTQIQNRISSGQGGIIVHSAPADVSGTQGTEGVSDLSVANGIIG